MENIDLRALAALLEEYKALKQEQAKRIGFRDNLIYVTIVAVGAVSATAVSKDGSLVFLLLVPWMLLVLGWTYLVNDEKISSLGRYIRFDLHKEVQEVIDRPMNTLFGWETAHRSDRWRVSRKWLQFTVDILTFVVSGLGCILVFILWGKITHWGLYVLCGVEAVLLIGLGIHILIYLDSGKGRGDITP